MSRNASNGTMTTIRNSTESFVGPCSIYNFKVNGKLVFGEVRCKYHMVLRSNFLAVDGCVRYNLENCTYSYEVPSVEEEETNQFDLDMDLSQ